MLERLTYGLTGMINRWSGAAPAACCGACKTCATEAATNLVVVGVGAGLEAAANRREEREERHHADARMQ